MMLERVTFDPALVYRRACEQLKIRPSRSLADQLSGENISVVAACLNPLDMKALSPSIAVCYIVYLHVLTVGEVLA